MGGSRNERDLFVQCMQAAPTVFQESTKNRAMQSNRGRTTGMHDGKVNHYVFLQYGMLHAVFYYFHCMHYSS
jgi:hypothetical protein